MHVLCQRVAPEDGPSDGEQQWENMTAIAGAAGSLMNVERAK
jgi:hypothetical protein